MSNLKERYVNPLTDFGFKKLFGTEPNKDILIEFLNKVLPDEKNIQELQFANSEMLGRSPLDRKAIFDVYCTSDTGEHFIVELQKVKQNFFKDRSIYYASFPIQEQATRGGWNFKLDAVYTVGILDFTFDEHADSDDFYHVVELKNQRNEVFSDKLMFIYVELPKFLKGQEELTSDRDKWLYVFRHLADLNDLPEVLETEVFRKLFAEAEIANFSKDEISAYENSLKYFRDLNNVVETSREEGFEAGLEAGLEAGRQAGLEKGVEEGDRKRATIVAKVMKENGMPVAAIMAATGLSEADIEGL